MVLVGSNARADGVPRDCTQLIVAVGPNWDAMHGRMRLFERERADQPWRGVSSVFPVLFGKNGLAWGTGLAGQDQGGLRKQERDGRAPAGIFSIGTIYTYDARLPAGADYPYHQVTPADAWIDDVTSPDYNRFVTIEDPIPSAALV